MSFKDAPNPMNEPGAFGVFGLFIVYLVVLTVGIFADFSIEKLESTMNVTAIAGLAVLCAAFWHSGLRNGTDAENGASQRDLRHAISEVNDPAKQAGSHATDRWGPASTIGFLNE